MRIELDECGWAFLTRARKSIPSISVKAPASRPIPSARVADIATDRIGCLRMSAHPVRTS